jgi:hypothetical protein
MHFAGLTRLRIDVDATVRDLRLYLPESEFLNIDGLAIATADGAALPPWKAQVSSAFSEPVRDAARLLSGLAIHTKKEPLPWWRVAFSQPVAIRSITISNRADRWAARGYGLCVDWRRADGVSETFDNLAIPVLLSRLDDFHARIMGLARGAMATMWSTRLASSRLHERVVEGLLELAGAVRGALTQGSAEPSALCARRSLVLALIAELVADLDDDRLRALVALAELAEALIWKGHDEPVATAPAEAALAPFILGAEFVRQSGGVEFKRFLEFQRLLPTRDAVERLERQIEQYCARLGGDTSLNPIMVRPHGIRGSVFVRDEMQFVRSVREVIGVLGEIGYPAALCQGTLLGAVREQRLLPHDDDVDIMFVAKAANANEVLAELAKLVEILTQRGVQAARVENHLFVKVTAPNAGKPVDAFAAFASGDGALRLHMEGLRLQDVPRELVEPFGAIAFYGEPAPVPARAEEFLEHRFGPGWRVPDRFSRLAWLRS